METIEIEIYRHKGIHAPFEDWLDSIPDALDKSRIEVRLARVRSGNFGENKSLGRDLREIRFAFGPGYRIYFVRLSAGKVLLLSGGTKGTQQRDLRRAAIYYAEYREAKVQTDA